MAKEEKNLNEQISLTDDLNQLESYIRDFWQFLPIPVCYVNPLFNIIDVDVSLNKISGYDQLEIIGQEIGFLFKDKENISNIEKELRENRVISGKRAIFLGKNGKEVPVSIFVMAREDEGKNIIGYFFALMDVTERERFEKELEKKIQEKTFLLREKVEELEKMNKLMVGRELKMIELKKQIQELKERLSQKRGI